VPSCECINTRSACVMEGICLKIYPYPEISYFSVDCHVLSGGV
jgi:hypothetical protein